MDPKLRQILLAADDPLRCEAPSSPETSFEDQHASILTIQQELLSQQGLRFDLDGCVQDASFFDELFILMPEEQDNRRRYGGFVRSMEFAIRFSNFGQLFTIHSCLDPIPDRYDVPSIIELIQKHDWRYVPADELEVPYDGINDHLKQARITWWIRFFDYL